LLSTDYGKLRGILKLLTPGLVFASDGQCFANALAAVQPPDAELVVTHSPPTGHTATTFAELLATTPTPAVNMAHAQVGPDTVAKFLFTSGSTGTPKGVINTQRMLCSNLEMIRSALAFLQDEPPVIVDWLPWHHTFGGNHNFGIALYNGGSLYLDDGKPLGGAIGETIRNLREIAPTVYFNVPKGYEMLIPFLRRDDNLRKNFFSRLKLLFYAAASLPQHVWEEIESLAVETCGERIQMITGLGATESAPSALFCLREVRRASVVGLPLPGVELKLVPTAGKLEARLRGPNVTPGYWRQPELTAAAFDEGGYYKLGDALRFFDDERPELGFVFDGRIAEDFKLSTGTWVSVGPLRARFVAHFAPYVRDIVVAGHDRDDLSALIVLDVDACRVLCADLPSQADLNDIAAHPRVRAVMAERLKTFARASDGSSTRIVRAIILTEPLSLDRGEVTDKGSVNQRAVLTNRAALVEELYALLPSDRVIVI
jgi:feruloyl-CoA synthase